MAAISISHKNASGTQENVYISAVEYICHEKLNDRTPCSAIWPYIALKKKYDVHLWYFQHGLIFIFTLLHYWQKVVTFWKISSIMLTCWAKVVTFWGKFQCCYILGTNCCILDQVFYIFVSCHKMDRNKTSDQCTRCIKRVANELRS